ncbi:mrna binding post-transcriptional regulator [Moniliophthora roreri MCA 2997]|uniref:Mrna binding post-transcriptional regulator n=2 Tax=Moniliophthora roreri TaxID=221103 RepID=V2XIT7_MONRO|nr:mrna binding post-transcriptional regulator [Moniliophthora roreri MCA 2997]
MFPDSHNVTGPPLSAATCSSSSSSNEFRTLIWRGLEPWMDEEYVKQVCVVMGWEPSSIKVPSSADPNNNNPGYCLLTFSSQDKASSVLSKIKTSSTPPVLPNSNKSFQMDFAISPQNPMPFVQTQPLLQQAQIQYPTEYSIFVGDLALEVSNSDLVAVFRNPVLGLRNDREPKFIRPFLSCKSAKIMLDPVTGISKGYGFVRFTDESDQQRALIEMHGLYCLSRPMRISAATTKPKPLSITSAPFQANQLLQGVSGPFTFMPTLSTNGVNDASVPAPPSQRPISISYNSIENSSQQPKNAVADFTEESWKHHTQARAILGNLIGPNGEQLSNTDPYNTTVFVGGLSPLINEDTLKTFFAPFGEIHYVKVPIGKNCGFVQFVRKADAQRAIEGMQGFPIAGSRIRLSWGRSQYKAAQAAAQAAHAAAVLSQSTFEPSSAFAPSSSIPPASVLQSVPNANSSPSPTSGHFHGPQSSTQQGPQTGIDLGSLTQEQAIHLLRALGVGAYPASPPVSQKSQDTPVVNHLEMHHLPSAGLFAEETLRAAHLASREDVVGGHRLGFNGSGSAHDPDGTPTGIALYGRNSGKQNEHLQHQLSHAYDLDLSLANLNLNDSRNILRPLDSTSSPPTCGPLHKA